MEKIQVLTTDSGNEFTKTILNTPTVLQSTPIFPVDFSSIPAAAQESALAGGGIGGIVEEEPTQLDGSSLNGSGISPIPSSLQDSLVGEKEVLQSSKHNKKPKYNINHEDSETNASGPFSSEKVYHSDDNGNIDVVSNKAPMYPPRTTAQPSQSLGTEHTTVRRAGTCSEGTMEWISAKAPPKNTAAGGHSAYPAPAQRDRPINSNTAGFNSAITSFAVAGAKPDMGVAPVTSTLEQRSLEELLIMQEQLQRLIRCKAGVGGHNTSNAVTETTATTHIHTAPTTATTTNREEEEEKEKRKLRGVDDKDEAIEESKSAPLQRQDTSYGLSQPSNQAISGLMQLKNSCVTSASLHLSSSPSSGTSSAAGSSVVNRPSPFLYTSAAAPHSSGAVRTHQLASSPTTSATDTTPSPTKRFFRRKLGGSPNKTAAAAVGQSEPIIPLREPIPESDDEEVPSPGRDNQKSTNHKKNSGNAG